jgi:two-component system, OmpR family, response regulator
MRVLLVEDDLKVSSYLAKGLKESGFIVDQEFNGSIALQRALGETFDVAVLDIMLPGMDGLSLLKSLRNHNIQLPILVLSAKNTTEDIIKGIQAGGDDYMVKPFSFAELLARLQGLLRRNQMQQQNVLTCSDLWVDIVQHRVKRAEQWIELQPMEFALLSYLIRKKGQVVSKTMIMEGVWDYNFDPQTNVVEARICRLREKIDRGFNHPLIQTIRGYGYCLREPHEKS